MTQKDKSERRITAAEVLRRYKEEDLPAFSEITLDSVNQVGNFGERPLNVASVRGMLEEVAALVDGGAEVDARGERGYTALHDAVAQGHVEIVKLLLIHGASPIAPNDDGRAPVETAAELNRREILALLKSPPTGD
jgi:ankyrin repeat protein